MDFCSRTRILGLAWRIYGCRIGKHEAIECYDKVLEIYPTFHMAWNMKDSTLDSLGKYKEAIECYDNGDRS